MKRKYTLSLEPETMQLLEQVAALEKRTVSNLVDFICQRECGRILNLSRQLDIEGVRGARKK